MFGGPVAGMGMLDVIALGVLALVAMRLLRTRAGQPPFASGHGGSGAPFGEAEDGRLDRDLDDTRGIRRADRAFDRDALAEMAALTFETVQDAWAARDPGSVTALFTSEMQASFQRECDQRMSRGRRSRIEDVSVDARVVDTWQAGGLDWATVRIGARMIDYTVDETTGQIVDGSAGEQTVVDEVWTFSRPVWAKNWRLSAIRQPGRAPARI